ncbi:MAG: thioredoxin domain-containing protein [Pseudobdellovibrionaceae bacterium]|jgi:protein-disulfide isomerase|nr:thioredoxin domain-containing protein [Pseudobdellovibrionaceae bacterium]
MSENKGSSKIIVVVLVVAVLAAALYFFMKNMEDFPPAPDANPAVETTMEEKIEPAQDAPAVAEVATEDTQDATAVDTITSEAPDANKPVVVDTKKLPIPSVAYPKAVTDPANAEIDAMMGDRVLGSNDAPIKVVEYSSLTCSHCASFHNADLVKIKENYIDTGKVQFIFKEYPLNQPAVIASSVLRCMPEDQFTAFMGLLFEQQQNWAYGADFRDKLIQYAKLAGLGEEKAQECMNNLDLQKRIIGDMKAAGDEYKIASTPTFVVNNGAKIIVGHQPYEFFQATFDAIASGKEPPSEE